MRTTRSPMNKANSCTPRLYPGGMPGIYPHTGRLSRTLPAFPWDCVGNLSEDPSPAPLPFQGQSSYPPPRLSGQLPRQACSFRNQTFNQLKTSTAHRTSHRDRPRPPKKVESSRAFTLSEGYGHDDASLEGNSYRLAGSATSAYYRLWR